MASSLTHDVYGLGLVAASYSAATTWYYDFDAVGSTAGVTAAGSTYADRYAYDPFGTVLQSSVTASQLHTFQAKTGTLASADGLYVMAARFYSPVAGRFTTTDPLKIAGGDANLYRFAKNAPSNFVDPTGEFITLPAAGRRGDRRWCHRRGRVPADPPGSRRRPKPARVGRRRRDHGRARRADRGRLPAHPGWHRGDRRQRRGRQRRRRGLGERRRIRRRERRHAWVLGHQPAGQHDRRRRVRVRPGADGQAVRRPPVQPVRPGVRTGGHGRRRVPGRVRRRTRELGPRLVRRYSASTSRTAC